MLAATTRDEVPRADVFSLAGYQKLVSELIARGYAITGYESADPTKAHLILRHDVDFDLELAVKLAEVEADRGWRSHYFVLLRTEFYNPFSGSGTRLVQRLVMLGHQVGLHFDASLYPARAAALEDGVVSECRLLGSVTERDVRLFSLHRPHPELLQHGIEVPGLLNAYGPRFFDGMGYCSDSRGSWRHGHPLDHAAVVGRRALQLLTHPIWWVDGSRDPSDKCGAFLDRRALHLDDEMQRNCQVYRGRESQGR